MRDIFHECALQCTAHLAETDPQRESIHRRDLVESLDVDYDQKSAKKKLRFVRKSNQHIVMHPKLDTTMLLHCNTRIWYHLKTDLVTEKHRHADP